jgi:hypothetical protein
LLPESMNDLPPVLATITPLLVRLIPFILPFPSMSPVAPLTELVRLKFPPLLVMRPLLVSAVALKVEVVIV